MCLVSVQQWLLVASFQSSPSISTDDSVRTMICSEILWVAPGLHGAGNASSLSSLPGMDSGTGQHVIVHSCRMHCNSGELAQQGQLLPAAWSIRSWHY